MYQLRTLVVGYFRSPPRYDPSRCCKRLLSTVTSENSTLKLVETAAEVKPILKSNQIGNHRNWLELIHWFSLFHLPRRRRWRLKCRGATFLANGGVQGMSDQYWRYTVGKIMLVHLIIWSRGSQNISAIWHLIYRAMDCLHDYPMASTIPLLIYCTLSTPSAITTNGTKSRWWHTHWAPSYRSNTVLCSRIIAIYLLDWTHWSHFNTKFRVS